MVSLGKPAPNRLRIRISIRCFIAGTKSWTVCRTSLGSPVAEPPMDTGGIRGTRLVSVALNPRQPDQSSLWISRMRNS